MPSVVSDGLHEEFRREFHLHRGGNQVVRNQRPWRAYRESERAEDPEVPTSHQLKAPAYQDAYGRDKQECVPVAFCQDRKRQESRKRRHIRPCSSLQIARPLQNTELAEYSDRQ